MTTRPRHKRRIKLIRPGLQLRLVGSFLGLTVLAMLLQFLLLSWQLIDSAGELAGVGGQLADQIPGMIVNVLAISVVVVAPLVLSFGILLTFRIAGPVYRFEQFLRSVAEGEQVEPCRLREGDELQSLCELVNAATASERARAAARRETHDEQDEAEDETTDAGVESVAA
ncbi:MAG: hypothetical protein GY711_32550 [bacterium]|nr:hypothetical protein [bacterium]